MPPLQDLSIRPLRRLIKRSHASRGISRSVRAESSGLRSYSDRELQQHAIGIREKISGAKNGSQNSSRMALDEITCCAGAAAEVTRRTFGFELHDVQIQAIMLAAQGASIEMQTGEGKTIVSAIVAYIRSHRDQVHLATTNHYLAERDQSELLPLFSRLGTRCHVISHDQESSSKREAYSADVTYGPGYQFGFDYLADQLTLRGESFQGLGSETLFAMHGISIDSLLYQPAELGCMLVDEADSVMIDEAMTPLVLSGPSSEEEDQRPYQFAKTLTSQLEKGVDFQIAKDERRIDLPQSTLDRLHHELKGLRRRIPLIRPWQTYIKNALRARELFVLNEDYVIDDDEIKIVDQFTGRIFEDRTWQDGLHQAVECEAGVSITNGNQVLAQITRQRYFRKYARLIGLSGTMTNVASELRSVYRMQIVPIPTHHPSKRLLLPTRFFVDESYKLSAIVRDVVKRHAKRQPVLIGTRTIKQSLVVHDAMIAAGLPAVMLNGIQDENEAEIVAEAGNTGQVTIATNMAGRGTDIKISPEAEQAGGLHVIGFEHNFSSRIDRQLIGRCARQGKPGSAQFFVSGTDDLVRKRGARLSKQIRRMACRDGEIRRNLSPMISKLQLQEEANDRRQRFELTQRDNWLDSVRKTLSDGTSK